MLLALVNGSIVKGKLRIDFPGESVSSYFGLCFQVKFSFTYDAILDYPSTFTVLDLGAFIGATHDRNSVTSD